MATIRWCPIFPKWDIYQPLHNPELYYLHTNLANFSAATRCRNRNSWDILLYPDERPRKIVTMAGMVCLFWLKGDFTRQI